ncbi:hypothetical protein ALC56_14478 [Trachymyrmex septentrionalis]|uniref:Uncharacterized protein n=1 Tax=Trachymyrmex septentrionalis TaxID=34720 RepID=A0A195ESI5_9HYME|nr:hypothetical protein ALC56_14478 [Trachymyrmex septentrionalis]
MTDRVPEWISNDDNTRSRGSRTAKAARNILGPALSAAGKTVGGREDNAEVSWRSSGAIFRTSGLILWPGSRAEVFPSRSEMLLALLLSTVPGGVVTLRPTLPWGSTRNAAGPPELPDGTIPHIDLNSAVWRADKLSDA